MKNLKKFMVVLLVAALCANVFSTNCVEAKGIKTKVYEFYASTVDKFQLSNGKLSIRTDDNYDISLLGDYNKIKNKKNNSIRGKAIKSNKMIYKADKNCKWRAVSVGEKISKDGNRNSYKQMKRDIKSAKTGEWDFGILVYVKGNKIVKVAARFS